MSVKVVVSSLKRDAHPASNHQQAARGGGDDLTDDGEVEPRAAQPFQVAGCEGEEQFVIFAAA